MAFQTVDLYSSGITIGMMENSPEREEGENPRATLRFRAIGSDDAGAAFAAMIDYLRTYWWQDDPGRIAAWQIPLKNVRMEKIEHAPAYNFECLFEFSDEDSSKDVNDPEYEYPPIQDSDYQFTTTGGTSHITHSLETLAAIPAEGYPLRNFDRGIGLNEDNSFDGCDIVTPHVSFTITVSRPRLFLTSDTRMLLAQATGAVNSAPFDGFAAGELRFNGINSNKVEYNYTENGQSYKNWYWRISYSFEASPNVPLVFNNVPVVKRGWDYVWQLVERKENTTTGQLDCAVRQLNVERVYPEFDFALLGLPLPE
jgi:hypothetical protein